MRERRFSWNCRAGSPAGRGAQDCSTPACSALGECPIGIVAAVRYGAAMNLILLVVVLILLFGGGGFYVGGPIVGGSGLGLVLLICLVIFLMGGFRKKA